MIRKQYRGLVWKAHRTHTNQIIAKNPAKIGCFNQASTGILRCISQAPLDFVHMQLCFWRPTL